MQICHLLYLIIAIVKRLISIQVPLQSHVMNNDFTLEKVSKLLMHVPYSLPTIKLCFGTPNDQCFNLAISLTSLTLMEDIYTNQLIFGKQYNHELSSTFKKTSPIISHGFFLQKISSYYVLGDEGLDVVTLLNSRPKKDVLFKFLLLNPKDKHTPISIDGFLGMNRYNYYSPNYPEEPTNSFLIYLFNTTQINRLNFALRYNTKGDGHISFGEDYGNYNKCSSDLEDKDKTTWGCLLTEVKIGIQKILLPKSVAQFDSVRNYVIAPSESGQAIFDYLIYLSNNTCETVNEYDYKILICNQYVNVNGFDNLYLTMDNIEIVLKWNYLFKYIKYQDRHIFVSSLITLNKDINDDTQTWIVGIPAFIDNTIVFDKDNHTIGLFKGELSDKGFKYTSMILIAIVVLQLLGIGLNMILKRKSFQDNYN